MPTIMWNCGSIKPIKRFNMEQINQFALQMFQESLSLGLLVIILIGLFRLANRVMNIAEMGVDRFLEDFRRIADGISDIAENTTTRKN